MTRMSKGMEKPSHSGLTSVDLFAGAGGLTEGFREAGIRTLVANELHQDASLTFRRNHPNTDLVTRDVHELSGDEVLGRANEILGTKFKRGDLDILAGGPPCQGFSFAGLKQQDDPRNQLVWQQLRLVEQLNPKFVVIENVEGMLKLYGGTLPFMVKSELEKLGYTVDFRVLYAAHYGVPQMRKRLFFIANRLGVRNVFPQMTHSDSGNDYGGEAKYRHSASLFDVIDEPDVTNLLPFVTVGDAISDLDFIEAGEYSNEYKLGPQTQFQRELRRTSSVLYNHLASKHNSRTIEYFSHMVPGGGVETIPLELRTKKVGIQRWHPDRISRAVVTAFEDFVHYRSNRIPTVREVARLQTFPDSYEFLGQRTSGNLNRRLTYSSQTQQVSNAVPPRLAKAVAQAIVQEAVSSKVF